MPRPDHRLFTGSFAALEPPFFAALDEEKLGDPLAPLDVLVGSNLAALYLRRAYAVWRGAHANVRFLTFLDLARPRTPDPRPVLPALAPLELARTALRQTPEAAAFGRLRTTTSLARAVIATADDLRDAGLAPERLAALLPHLAASPDRLALLHAVSATVSAFEAGRRRFADATSLLERAAAEVETAAHEPRPGDLPAARRLLVYGLHDLGGIRSRLLAGLATRRAITAFVPDGDGEGEADPPDRAALFSHLLGVTPREAPAVPPAPVSAVVAPSDAHEAREVVREVLAAVDEGVPLHRVAILLRDPARQEAPIAAELSRVGVPFYRGLETPFSRTPAGRAARLLVDISAVGWQRAPLLELLTLLPAVQASGELGAVRRALDLLGGRRGRAAWEASLEGARRRLAAPAVPDPDADARFVSRRERSRQDVEALGRAMEPVLAAAPDPSPARWRQWGERLEAAFHTLFGGAEGHEHHAGAARAIAALDAVDDRLVPAADVLELLPDALDVSRPPGRRFERDGVSLLSLVAARGLRFDVVIVPGLVEKLVPAPPRPDPLLFDDERERLRELTGLPLVARGGRRHSREERFLFRLATESATRKTVLLASRRDLVTDRARLLSPYLVSALEARAGSSLSEARILDREGALARLPFLSRVSTEGPPLDEEEVDRRLLARDASARSAAADRHEPVRRALARANGRFSQRFTEYEGRLGRAPAFFDLAGSTLSAGRLERFASCPYRAFLADGLHIATREDLDEELMPETRNLGGLAHAVMRDLAREAARRGLPLGRLPVALTEALAEEMVEREVARWLETLPQELPPVLVDQARLELGRIVGSFLEHERQRPGALPVAGAEVRFGPSPVDPRERDDDAALSSDVAPTVSVDGKTFRFAGKIDRIDRLGPAAHLVDYKVGKPAPYLKTNRNSYLVAGGERLQLPLYAVAAARLGAEEVTSEYVFVPRPFGRDPGERVATPFSAAGTRDAVERLRLFLAGAASAVASGHVLPLVNGIRWPVPCKICEFADICAPGHEELFEKKWERETQPGGDPAAAALLALKDLK